MNKQIVVGGLLINYNEISGSGERALLFLHGWRSNKEVWQTVLGQLSIVNCQLFAMDLPGFGKSEIPKQVMTVGDYANVVAEFIKKLDLHNVAIIGHSFGGRVGIKLSSAHPELISKLVLVDSAGFVTEQTKKRVMQLGAKLVKPFFLPKFMQGARRKIYKFIGADDYVATPWLTETFIRIKNEDLTEDMKKIKSPALIVTGENDQDTPVEFGRRMNSLIPNSKFIILKDAGHFSFIDQPKKFIEILNGFLQ